MADAARYLAAWAKIAERLTWVLPPDDIHVPDPAPRGSWFPGGRLNVAGNCLDRHLPERRGDVAFYWEGEPEDRRVLTYGGLAKEVGRFAVALRSLGVEPGHRVALYMGLLPETVVAMLACARLGAVHTIMPAVLPPEALEERMANIGARVLVTQDGAWRHGVILPLKSRADEAVAAVSSVQHTIVVRRTGIDVAWYEGDRWYHELVASPGAQPAGLDAFPSEHPLCVAHVANRRERPTGVVHGSANFLAYLIGLHSEVLGGRDEVFWFPSEIGWLASQGHAVYGPLVVGGTGVLYEGMLDTPSHDRAWEIVERYGVGVLAATPSIIQSLRSWSGTHLRGRALGSLRRLITAGEALDDDLASWLDRELGPRGVQLLDAWGETELGGIVAFNLPSDVHLDVPDPGLDVVDQAGRALPAGSEGELVLREPWPGTLVALEADDLRDLRSFSRHRGCYATGDRAVRHEDGTLRFLGRIDPVISVAGQLVSQTEIEEALLEHPYVRRAIVSERRDGRLGVGVVALVQPDSGADHDRLTSELSDHIKATLGGLSRPRTILFADELPGELSDEELRRAVRTFCSSHRIGATAEVRGAELAEIASVRA
jgi:acetyl-CoA synthetase